MTSDLKNTNLRLKKTLFQVMFQKIDYDQMHSFYLVRLARLQ